MGKETHRVLVREALRTDGSILTDIAENSQTATRKIVSKYVTDTTQNIRNKLRGAGGGRKRNRLPSALRIVKRKRTTTVTQRKSERVNGLKRVGTIKRDIFFSADISHCPTVSDRPATRFYD